MDSENTLLCWADNHLHELISFVGPDRWRSISSEEQYNAIRECRARVELEDRKRQWASLCPPAYRRTAPEQLPDVAKYAEVQRWTFGAQGLLVIGGTRLGKTRSVWRLLERLHFEERRTIVALSPMALKAAVADAFRSGDAEDWLQSIRKVDVLFLDDLDTIKLTEAVEEVIYEIFEYRPSHDKPVIVTINQCGSQLGERMSTLERGQKIVERMREACSVVNFDQDATA